jgi:hypothetical protein
MQATGRNSNINEDVDLLITLRYYADSKVFSFYSSEQSHGFCDTHSDDFLHGLQLVIITHQLLTQKNAFMSDGPRIYNCNVDDLSRV